jgi:hypothetical protein
MTPGLSGETLDFVTFGRGDSRRFDFGLLLWGEIS